MPIVMSSWPIARSSVNSQTPDTVPSRPPASSTKASARSTARRRQ